MFDDLDQRIKLAIYQIMEVLNDLGLEEAHVGGIMRCLGIPDEEASKHDDERMRIDDEFLDYIAEFYATDDNTSSTQNYTIH